MGKIKTLIVEHWFYSLVPLWLALGWLFWRTFPWEQRPAQGELFALAYWCLILPSLFALCFRSMPIKALAIRLIALVCGGVWLAGITVPDEAERLLIEWGWLRYAGLALLTIVEGVALVAVLRLLFGGTVDEAELQKQGIPPLVARLMLAEVRFWRWIGRGLSGK